jgi:ribonuclease HI
MSASESPLAIVAHVAVAYVRGRKAGMSIVQEARDGTGVRSDILPRQECARGIPRARFVTENIKTPQRCEMLGLLLALGAAHGKLKRGAPLQNVTVYCASPWVVQTVNHYLQNSRLENIISTNDRSMLKRVLANIRRVSKRSDVKIVLSNPEDNAAQRAMTLARRKVPRVYRRRIVRPH